MKKKISQDYVKLRKSHDNLLKNLERLVKCIRNFELGDYSSFMDEIFDLEDAIRKAKKL